MKKRNETYFPDKVIEFVRKWYRVAGASNTAELAGIRVDQCWGIAYRLGLTEQRSPMRTPAETRNPKHRYKYDASALVEAFKRMVVCPPEPMDDNDQPSLR